MNLNNLVLIESSVPRSDGEPSPSHKKRIIALFKILSCIFPMCVYICDVGSDIFVAVTHYQDGNETYFHLTVVFIVLPAIIMSLTSFRWYIKDNSVPHLKVCKAHWIIRMMLLILLMAPALRYAEAIYYARKSFKSRRRVDKDNYTQMMFDEKTDALCLRLIEAFLECAPQFILQLFIISQKQCDGSNNISATEIVQFFSIVMNVLSMTRIVVLYLRNRWEILDRKKEVKWYIRIFPLHWRFFELTARVVTLGLFASVLLPYFFLVCSVHFCAMFVWIRFMNTDFCTKNKFAEFMYNFVFSFMYIFCFINPNDDRTQMRYLVYYSLMFVENTALISLWYHHCSFGYRLPVLCMVFVCFALAMVLYYVLLLPTRGRLFGKPNPEETLVRPDSKFVIDQFTLNRELICRSGRGRGTSEGNVTS